MRGDLLLLGGGLMENGVLSGKVIGIRDLIAVKLFAIYYVVLRSS